VGGGYIKLMLSFALGY